MIYKLAPKCGSSDPTETETFLSLNWEHSKKKMAKKMAKNPLSILLVAMAVAPLMDVQAASFTFDTTMTWGGSDPSGFDADKLWTGYLPNANVASLANSTQFNQLSSGFNGRNYYNPDEANSASCAPRTAYGYKYGCIDLNTFDKFPIAPSNPGPAASASGQMTVTTDTSTNTVAVTGVLAVSPYNYRLGDGSPFGNIWYGVTGGTLTLNLTGAIVASNWLIDSGTAVFSNPDPDGAGVLTGFQCSTLAGSSAAPCVSTIPGAPGNYQSDGGQLSFLPFNVFSEAAMCTGLNACNQAPLSTLSGILATLSVDQDGNLITVFGEYRRGLASAANSGNLAWNPGTQTFGANSTFYAGPLSVSGTVVPLPAGLWLLLTAVGSLASVRWRVSRRSALQLG